MGMYEESIEVEVPVGTAYDQWTRFEEFPLFMEGVEKVVRIDSAFLRWNVQVGRHHREWEAEVTEETPDQRVAWRSLGDIKHDGLVTLEALDDSRCRVTLQIEATAKDFVGKAGDPAMEERIRSDLKRFKELIEGR